MTALLSTRHRSESGAVLVMVLWIAFGVVSLALYFGQSTLMELRASENRAAGMAAKQAIDGASRYVGYFLSHLDEPGKVPAHEAYLHEEMQIGDAKTWLIGRDSQQQNPTKPYYALVDEASKLNINTATLEMLEALPGMTAQLAAAIIDWRDEDSDVTTGGAEDETYLRLTPAYHCKNAKFESLGELRLVSGADLDLLYGEDANLNGVLDQNEDDGDATLPQDNRDGHLDAGLLEYLTVYSRESTTNTDGTARVPLSGPGAAGLRSLFESKLAARRAEAILGRPNDPPRQFSSPLDLYIRGGFSENEFTNIETSLTMTNGAYVEGLVNVCTASAQVLACIPGIGVDKAAELVAYRAANPDKMGSVAWVASVLDRAAATQAGPYLTGRSYQFTADIAGVGRFGRGFRRERFVFDLTSANATARVVAHEDLTHHGWALGRQTWQTARDLAANNR